MLEGRKRKGCVVGSSAASETWLHAQFQVAWSEYWCSGRLGVDQAYSPSPEIETGDGFRRQTKFEHHGRSTRRLVMSSRKKVISFLHLGILN
jgi:hypothetical protein